MPTLYLTEPGSMLEKEAGRLIVTMRDEVLLAAPATRVDQVVIVGNAGVTTPALAYLLDHRIGLVFLTTRGAFRGRLTTDHHGNVALRRTQYQRADDESHCLAIGRAIVEGKIRNQRALCLRLDDTNRDRETLAAAQAMRELIDELPQVMNRQRLMGHEGRAARYYFSVMRRSLRAPWFFSKRARRPPPDPVNALLSLLYTFLHESCFSALQAVGLDPACGFLHRPRAGRASLALDLMEEFRPVIADSVMLTVLNRNMLAPEDFEPGPKGGIVLTRNGWRVVTAQYAVRMQTLVRPPGVERRISYQKVLEVQARALKQAIVDPEVAYTPFRIR